MNMEENRKNNEQQPSNDEQQPLTDESEGLTDEQYSLIDEQHEQRPKVIVNHNTNCQVFNGPISGCIFAMPGSHVEQHPVQYVTPEGGAAPAAANSSTSTSNSTSPAAASSSTSTAAGAPPQVPQLGHPTSQRAHQVRRPRHLLRRLHALSVQLTPYQHS